MRHFKLDGCSQTGAVTKLLSYLICAFVLLAAPGVHAQGRLANQELFEKTGLMHSVDAVSEAITESIGQPNTWSPTFWNRFVKAWRANAPLAYQPDKMRQAIDESFEKDLSDEHKRHIIAFFSSPLGRRVAAAEAAALRAQPAIQQYARNPSAYANRAAFYKELDQETNASDLGALIVENLTISVHVAVFKAADMPVNADALRAKADREHADLIERLQEGNIASFAYTYRDLTLDELKTYIAFVKTPAARKFNALVGRALEEVIMAQADEFTRLMIDYIKDGKAR